MSDIKEAKVRVLSNVFAGNRVWNVDVYPNEKNPDARVLIRIAKELEENGIPLKDRAVVLCGEIAEKSIENPFDSGVNINIPPNPENSGEPLKNNVDNDDEDGTDEDGVNEDDGANEDDESSETEYLPIEDFAKLKAKEQKDYLQSLYDNENVEYEKFYELASDYMQVVESTTVKNYINKCFAEMESENEDE